MQYCTDLSRQVTFPAHTELGKTGPGLLESTLPLATDFKEAACCPSGVVQTAARRKNGLCEGSARCNWDPRKGQQPFLPNPNGVGDRTTTLRRLLVGAGCFFIAMVFLVWKVVMTHLTSRPSSEDTAHNHDRSE